MCEWTGHARLQCRAVVTHTHAPIPPLHVYFGAELLGYNFTDCSYVPMGTATSSLPSQQWGIEQLKLQQQQFRQQQLLTFITGKMSEILI